MNENKRKSKDLIMPGKKVEPRDNKPGWVDTNKAWFSYNKDIISIKTIKDLFMRDLDRARRAEKEHCEQTKESVKFTNTAYNEVVDLLDQCKNFAEVEALAQFIFTDNWIPTMEEVKQRGFAIYLNFPKEY